MNIVPILYSGFYDYPLAFAARHLGKVFLFWRKFDEGLDDYPPDYRVYELPMLTDEQIKQSWAELRSLALAECGTVPVRAIRFDSTHRKEIGTDILVSLMKSEQAVAV